MESHNGLTNGVNGTADITVVEHSTTTVEVKSIESISISETVQIQGEVTQPAFIESAPQQLNESISTQQPATATTCEVVQPEIQPVDQQSVSVTPEIVVNTSQLSDSVTVTPPEVTTVTAPPEVTTAASSPEVTTAASPPEVTTAASQQLPTERPASTGEVKVVPTPTSEPNVTISLPGSQPGSSDFQVPTYAINALNRIAQTEGFTNYVINYDRGSNFGDGFVAEIIRAKIIGSQMVKGVQEESELVLVLKLPPENKARRETMGMKVFEREVTAYNEILPMFQKFQLDKGLKPGQGFVSFPKCYYASFDKEKDESVIIMEDIRRQGFKMLNKYKTVDFEHAKAVLETVAQLHGLSLAMKDQCPGVFDKFKGLKDVMADEMLSDMMKSVTISSCEKAIEALEPHEESLKKKLRAFGENLFDIVKTCTNGELVEPYTVLNHGDCWVNNIMFKYQSGFPNNLCLLDWQIVRYASPVLDISYFIYQCTDSALRAQHFDNLIQGYHIALRKQVELLGSDINQILPFTALLREMKSKAKFALSTALFIIPMLCTPNAELPNMDEVVETMAKGEMKENEGMFQMSTNTELLYKRRMGGIIRDMHKKGYL